jgi:hypothetical protein
VLSDLLLSDVLPGHISHFKYPSSGQLRNVFGATRPTGCVAL